MSLPFCRISRTELDKLLPVNLFSGHINSKTNNFKRLATKYAGQQNFLIELEVFHNLFPKSPALSDLIYFPLVAYKTPVHWAT